MMTKAELIEALADFDDDAEIVFTYNYGDYWRTTVAASIDEVTPSFVKHSDYHNMDKVVDEDEREDGVRFVVALS